MTFAHPALLALLAAVPLLLWLHRRRAPRVVRVASVDPYRGDGTAPAAAPRRGFDALLAALLASVACLALAASRPSVIRGTPVVAVVRDTSASMSARTASGATVGERAEAVAATALDGVEVEEFARIDGATTIDAALVAAMSAGFGGVAFVTDRVPATADPRIVVLGPDAPALPNAGIVRVWMERADDGADRAYAVVRNFSDDAIRFVTPGGAADVEHTVAARADEVIAVAVPPRGGESRVEMDASDSLALDDARTIRRVGGARSVRVFGRSSSLDAALRALRVGAVTDGAADAAVVDGGAVTPSLDAAVVHLAPGGSESGAPIRVVAGPRTVDAATLVQRGDGDFPIPAPVTRLAATCRLVGGEAVLADGAGVLVARAGPVVVVALDPDDPASDWARDGSFVATVGAALDLATGGPERIEFVGGPDPAEGDVARVAVPAPPAGAVRGTARPGASTDLSAALAIAGAALAAVAALVGRRRR